MFDNIGGKIKELVKLSFGAGVIICCIYGLVSIKYDGVGTGLLYIIGGSLICWISSFIIYGFGQLVEDTQALRKKFCAGTIEKVKDAERTKGTCQICHTMHVTIVDSLIVDDTGKHYCQVCEKCFKKFNPAPLNRK